MQRPDLRRSRNCVLSRKNVTRARMLTQRQHPDLATFSNESRRPRCDRTRVKRPLHWVRDACLYCENAWLMRFVGDTRFGKRRHAGVARKGRAQNRDRECGARRFAETHIEIEQRLEAEFLQQCAVSGFG